MGKVKLISGIMAFLMIGMFCVLNVNADPVDDYNLRCASCHGEDGYGEYAIDGSYCSMRTLEEIIECYPTIAAHDSVTDCGDTCVSDTNGYIFNQLLIEIGRDQYEDMCAVCHGDNGMEGAPIDGSDCDLSTIENIVACYPEINAHASITECDEACIWNVNRYIFEELLGNGASDTTDDTDSDTSEENDANDDDGASGDDSTNEDDGNSDNSDSSQSNDDDDDNENWANCFIDTCLLK
ncbi:MAG: c-type cytochrome [Desulfobacteraceae bacterium]|jgi:hypothetical protein